MRISTFEQLVDEAQDINPQEQGFRSFTGMELFASLMEIQMEGWESSSVLLSFCIIHH